MSWDPFTITMSTATIFEWDETTKKTKKTNWDIAGTKWGFSTVKEVKKTQKETYFNILNSD